ncbi:MAG: T9SS type A sorting domain-containing protein [Ginsengibacter sp.]
MRLFTFLNCVKFDAKAQNAREKFSWFFKVILFFITLTVLHSFDAKADYTIPAGSTVDASTLLSKTGVLTINGTLLLNSNVDLDFTSVIINGPNGQIFWNKNVELRFNSGTSIIINNPGVNSGLQPTEGNGNAAQRLVIGGVIISVSSDNANNAHFSFEQFNSLGGLPKYTITGDISGCTSGPVSLKIDPVYSGKDLKHTYSWSVLPVATFTTNNDSSNVQLNNLLPGVYIVTCKATVQGGQSTAYNTINTVTVTIRPKNTWFGKNTDWNNPANWCPGIPDENQDVIIPVLSSSLFYPEITKGTIAVRNLKVAAGASLKIGSQAKISIAGTITNNGVLDFKEGTVEFNGTTMQTLSGSQIKHKSIGNLIVSNSAGLEISKVIGDTLNITGDLTFGTTKASLNTGDNITLKSTILRTANLGVVGIDNIIKGKFIVERYINTGTDKSLNQHGKAWMHLATPTIGSTIYESWQEAGKATGITPIANTQSGYGTLLTTPYNNVPANGFDLYTGAGPSMKTFNSATGKYDNGPVSTNELIYNEQGYMVMVRGDRSVFTYNALAKPVVMRTKGVIVTGTTKEMPVQAGTWASIGNPYASKIYISKIEMTGGVDEFIYLWDPKLGGTYGLGAFQTLYKMGDTYKASPGGGSYVDSSVSYIESGQAFFVQATKNNGSVYFTEDVKTPPAMSIQRGAGPSGKVSSLQTTIYALGSGEAVLADGNLMRMSDSFSNDIDGKDARKMSNSAENFSIRSAGSTLSLESRQNITANDTLFFHMSGMRAQDYQMEIKATNFAIPGMQAWLEDKFLQTQTPIDLTANTTIPFTVSNQSGASSSDRFMIIFRPAAVLPVTFTGVKATKSNNDILVEWTIENEEALSGYEVESSIDGIEFNKIGSVASQNRSAGKYEFLDKNVASGNHYYRIKSLDLDGRFAYSHIVKVTVENAAGSLSVFPNPITHGQVSLQLNNQEAGEYNLRLFNPVGQVLLSKKINHTGGNYTEKMNWDNSLPRGMYTLEVSNIQTGVKMIKLIF